MTLKTLRSYIRLNTTKNIDDTVLDALINVAKNNLFNDIGGVDDIVYATPTLSLVQMPDSMLSLDKVELNDEILDRLYKDSIYTMPTSFESPDWKSVVLGGRVIR